MCALSTDDAFFGSQKLSVHCVERFLCQTGPPSRCVVHPKLILICKIQLILICMFQSTSRLWHLARLLAILQYSPLSHSAWLGTRPGRSACARSLGSNNIINYGEDMSAVIKLAEVLPQTKIETLKCAVAERICLLESDTAPYPHCLLFAPRLRRLR